jgi:hypothetical protein
MLLSILMAKASSVAMFGIITHQMTKGVVAIINHEKVYPINMKKFLNK